MSELPFDPTVANWPKMARAINEASKQLQAKYMNADIPSAELEQLAEKIGNSGANSIFPPDYCYNRINKAKFSFEHAVLVFQARGWYRYVGPHFPYDGPIFWHPKGKDENKLVNGKTAN